MDQSALEAALAGLPLGPVRYFTRTGSTNDEAARWAAAGAPDLALVAAGEQTAGRGRLGRSWHTPPGAALAFSLILRPGGRRALSAFNLWTHLTALGALAVAAALEERYGLPAEIKWPNDVLVERRKLAGVLVEAEWQGAELSAAILGIGVNVAHAAVPDDPRLNFPATCVENCLGGRPVDRLELLRAVLEKLLEWRSRLGRSEFMRAWESRLAFRGEWVRISEAGPGPALPDQEAAPAHGSQASRAALEGQILGLEPDGALRLRDRAGEIHRLQVGEIQVRGIASSE